MQNPRPWDLVLGGKKKNGIVNIIGGSARQSTIQGERDDLMGWRCYSVAFDIPIFPNSVNLENLSVLLDSGAFSRSPELRISCKQVLILQMQWELKFAHKHNLSDFLVKAICSNDLLIDETWVDGNKYKRRWSEEDAEWAVKETVNAAHYLASQRKYLSPRHLVLGVQGVTAKQYQNCLEQILPVAAPGDWIGLGGWCILGRMRCYLPTFYEVLHACIPLIAQSPVQHVHIFGVMLGEALGPLSWMCDRYGLTCSADSNRAWKDLTRSDKKRSGARKLYWRDNVEWWNDYLANISKTPFYKEPPLKARQLDLFDLFQYA